MFNNKQKMLSRLTWQICLMSLLLSCHVNSYASLDVMDDDMDGFYGEAGIQQFKQAVEGSETLSDRDRAFMDGVQESRVNSRWYARALVGRSKVRLNNLVQKSVGTTDITFSQPSMDETLFQFFLAGGYVWENWALEAELFLSKPFKVNPVSKSTSDPNSNVQAKVNPYALFINLQYILPRWVDFYPQRLQLHIDAGAGVAMKSTTTSTVFTEGTGTNEASSSARLLSVIGQLGVGARYQITPNWLVDIAYRYFDLGKTKFGPVLTDQFGTLAIYESMNFRCNGFFAGFTYQA